VSGTRPAASVTPAPNGGANARSSASIPAPKEKLVYGVEDVDVDEPVAVIQRLPVWSPVGSEVKAEFKGLLQIVIDPRGNVTNAEMRISAHPKYDADLIRMARGWKFRPASKNGVPVAYTKLIDIMLRPSSARDD
jgi:TonB family protein